MIEVSHLTKIYGNNVAVDDLSFNVEKGKIYGLLGANGAGKSTTMNIITGYIGATEGTVVVDGHDIFEEPEEAKKCIGYLPEIPPLYLDMTVKEYLKFSAELKMIPKADRQAAVEDALQKTRVKEVEDRLISNLSKGYKQRVGLAQAIIGMPDIIILDEPTVGLDPVQIIEIRDLIKELGKDHTVILSSHILSEVSAICEHIFIISNGRLVASDTPENLTKLGNTKNTVMLEVMGDEENIKEVLEKDELIIDYRVEHKNDNIYFVEVDTDINDDIRADLFYAFADSEQPILQMNMETKSLEDIFMELTTGETQQRNRKPQKSRKTDKHKEIDEDIKSEDIESEDAKATAVKATENTEKEDN